MTPEAAAALAAKLTAAADSLTDERAAANYRDKAAALRRKYQLTEPAPSSEDTPPKPRQASTAKARNTFREGTPRMNVKTAAPRPARRARATAKTMHAAMNPKIKPAFAGSDPIGTEVSGFVIRIEEEQEKDWVTKKPAVDRRTGAPIMVPVVILQTDGTTRRVGPGLRKLWMRSGVRDAILEAVLDAGAREPAAGAFLRITFSGLGTPVNVNFRPAKLFDATYTPPETGTAAPESVATQPNTTSEEVA
ncbi:hypothetical protein [Nocardia sp. NPDC057030]|uniref:hypothetical protein n=1 Tax=unclassified Nocardia TaxID=2637762 RepID=UPI0036358D2B